jgi:hypothetical protein
MNRPGMPDMRLLSIYAASVAAFALAAYGMAVAADFAIYFTIKRAEDSPQERIERRREELDGAAAHELRRKGFEPMILPLYFDEPEWKALAQPHQVLPLAPQPRARVYFCNEGYGLKTYVTDRYGFRNPDAAWRETGKGIAIIGDSFAQGACVEEAESIGGRLRQGARPVLNLATSANEPMHYASLARVFLPVVRPSWVVMIFYANDNVDEEGSIYAEQFPDLHAKYFSSPEEGKLPELSASLKALYRDAVAIARKQADEEFEKRRSGEPPDDEEPEIEPLASFLKLRHLRATISEILQRGRQKELHANSRLAIDETIRQCGSLHCKALFVYIPNSEYWRPDPGAKTYAKALQSYVRQVQPDIPLLDLTRTLHPLGVSAYAPEGAHLSIAGYKLAADAIARAIAARDAVR